MSQKEKNAKKPGSNLIPIGLMLVGLSVVLLVVNLSTTTHTYVVGRGMVEGGGTPSPGFWIGLLLGLLLTGIGFGRRLLAAVERQPVRGHQDNA